MTKKTVKEPIITRTMRIFCANCDKDMGIVESLPIYLGYEEGMKDEKQNYEYIIEHKREEGYTVFYTRTFCSKKCRKEYIKQI